MGDKVAPVAPVQQQGLIKRLLELVMMGVSMLLVIFAWGEVGKAKEEAASLRGELRQARCEQADRQGTVCTVCLVQPRQAVLQPCGHVCLCSSCALRIQHEDNQCPMCRSTIEKVAPAFIS